MGRSGRWFVVRLGDRTPAGQIPFILYRAGTAGGAGWRRGVLGSLGLVPSLSRFTLERGRWYAWTMHPGYGGGPYHSPIFVNEVKAVCGRRFRLTFFNAGYASGVQGFEKTLKTVVREAEYLAAVEELESETRLCVLHDVDHGWLHQHWQNWFDLSPPSDGENVQTYLTGRFGER